MRRIREIAKELVRIERRHGYGAVVDSGVRRRLGGLNEHEVAALAVNVVSTCLSIMIYYRWRVEPRVGAELIVTSRYSPGDGARSLRCTSGGVGAPKVPVVYAHAGDNGSGIDDREESQAADGQSRRWPSGGRECFYITIDVATRAVNSENDFIFIIKNCCC